MNHSRRGKVWSDAPVPPAASLKACYKIERVSIKVGRAGSAGRYEAHTTSRSLIKRLDEIGKSNAVLMDFRIGGYSLPTRQTVALNLYLKAATGLRSIRRAMNLRSTRADLVALLSCVGINYHLYEPEPTSEVPAIGGSSGGA